MKNIIFVWITLVLIGGRVEAQPAPIGQAAVPGPFVPNVTPRPVHPSQARPRAFRRVQAVQRLVGARSTEAVSPFGSMIESGLDTGSPIGEQFGSPSAGPHSPPRSASQRGVSPSRPVVPVSPYGHMADSSLATASRGELTGPSLPWPAHHPLSNNRSVDPTSRVTAQTLPSVTRHALRSTSPGIIQPMSMAPEAIRHVVLSHQNEVTGCYRTLLRREPDARGRVVLRWMHGGERGAVSQAEIVESDIRNPAFQTCLLNVVRAWRFPVNPGIGTTTVSYPFNFAREGERHESWPED